MVHPKVSKSSLFLSRDHALTQSAAFPEDDRLEYDVVDAQRQHEKIQRTLNAESRAAELLARASKAMDMCQKNMQEALGYSQYGALDLFHTLLILIHIVDMWGGGSYVLYPAF